MRKITFITPPDARYGFNLAGIGQIVTEISGAEETVKTTIKDAANGLVVIDERLVATRGDGAGLPEERLRELERQWRGIILVLPSPEKPPPEIEDYAARLIRRAIGYHVRLKL